MPDCSTAYFFRKIVYAHSAKLLGRSMASKMQDCQIVSDTVSLDRNEKAIILSNEDADSLKLVVNPLRGQSVEENASKICRVTREILPNLDTSTRGVQKTSSRNKRSSVVPENTRRKSILDPHEVTIKTKCKACCKFETVVLINLSYILGILHFYIFLVYSGYLGNASFSGVIYAHVAWSALFILLPCYYLYLFGKLFRHNMLKSYFSEKRKLDRKKSFEELVPTWFQKVYQFKRNFNLNGKWFLLKLYISEQVEHINQAFNLFSTFFCTLPLSIVYIVIGMFVLEICYSTWGLFQVQTSIGRDRQIIVDLVVDMVTLCAPVGIIWWVYNIPLDIDSLFQLTLVPSYCLLFKLRTLIREQLKLTEREIQNRRNDKRTQSNRYSERRLSLGKIELQLSYVPKFIKYICAGANICFLAFYSTLVFTQMIQRNMVEGKRCIEVLQNNLLWENCIIPTPFCKNPYVAMCDCSVLEIPFYNSTALPPTFLEMYSLRKVGIFSGKLARLPNLIGSHLEHLKVLEVWNSNLTRLPEDIGHINGLLWLHLGGNKLEVIPESIGKLSKLSRLNLDNNRLDSLPESIGNLGSSLFTLQVRHNNLAKLPRSFRELKNMLYAFLSNNCISELPDDIFDKMNYLQKLHLQNNRLATLPRVDGLTSLRDLLIWNNLLSSLPNIGDHSRIQVIDVRHNNLTQLPSSLWYVNKILGAGNFHICSDDGMYLMKDNMKVTCARQCAINCPAISLNINSQGYFVVFNVNENICNDNDYIYANTRRVNGNVLAKTDSGCNVAACNYDGGKCKSGNGFIKYIDRM